VRIATASLQPRFDAAPCGPCAPAAQISNDESSPGPQDARGLANRAYAVDRQAQHRHDHDDIEAPVWKRQPLDPAFDEP
jgi:hypothetical protein